MENHWYVRMYVWGLYVMCVLISKHRIICCFKGLKVARMQKNTFHVLLDGRCFHRVPLESPVVVWGRQWAQRSKLFGSAPVLPLVSLVLFWSSIRNVSCTVPVVRMSPPFPPPPLNLNPQMSSFGKYLVETFLHFLVSVLHAMVLHRCNDKCRLCYLLTINKKK